MFLDLSGMAGDMTAWGQEIKTRLWDHVKIPVGVGIAPTKTLAKLASRAAKKIPRCAGVCVLDQPRKWEWVLRWVPVTAVWGVAKRLALAQVDDNRDTLHAEAEKILRRVWEKEPTHPGAIHYTIHATDADGRAKNALDIVQEYGKIAPQVPHALHMPTHIYVRLGDWPKVIDWNQRSADASLRNPVKGDVSHHYLHAVDYLLYAYLQRGEDREALAVFSEAMAKDRHQPSFISTFHLAAMPARLAVERHQWGDAIALEPGTPDYLPWEKTYWPLGLTWFARGLGGCIQGIWNSPERPRRGSNNSGIERKQAGSACSLPILTWIVGFWPVPRVILKKPSG